MHKTCTICHHMLLYKLPRFYNAYATGGATMIFFHSRTLRVYPQGGGILEHSNLSLFIFSSKIAKTWGPSISIRPTPVLAKRRIPRSQYRVQSMRVMFQPGTYTKLVQYPVISLTIIHVVSPMNIHQ